MDTKMTEILAALNFQAVIHKATSFCAEEDGKTYQVWKLDTDKGSFVLKKTRQKEWEIYHTFFPDSDLVPRVYAFGSYKEEWYMLMEYVQGTSLSHCYRQQLQRALDTLILSQERYWEDTVHAEAGYPFETAYRDRKKWLAYMGDLSEAYQAYLDEFSRLPRTLCNDDMLPFNILINEDRAVMIDWEYAGILPYPCAIARLLAFGEEDSEALFQMTEADRQFALDYYYENFIKARGISRAEYDHSMQLFFLKEYCEWVYCAASSGDYEMEYYKKYYPKAKELSEKLGFSRDFERLGE